MSWVAILIVGTIVLALIIFIVFKNQKDEQRFEEQMKQDYKHPKDSDSDIDIDKKME